MIDRDGRRAGGIALADVVTGKPVPPRASVRHRVSARARSSCTSPRCGPTVTTEPLGDVGAARAPAARRPAAQARQLGAGDGRARHRLLDGRLERVRAFYAALGQRADRRRCSATATSSDELPPLGWAPLGERRRRTPSSARVARALRSVPRRPRADVPADARRVGGPAHGPRSDGGAAAGAGRRSTATGCWPRTRSTSTPEHRRRGLGHGRDRPSCSTGAPRRGATHRVAARGERQRPGASRSTSGSASSPTTPTATSSGADRRGRTAAGRPASVRTHSSRWSDQRPASRRRPCRRG